MSIDIEADLQAALQAKTIKARSTILQNCLGVCGRLNNASKHHWIALFDTYYTPDDSETKYALERIQNVYIQVNPLYGTHGFCMELCDGTKCVASYKRLAGVGGGKRKESTNLTRALRDVIYYQIIQFKERNPLDPTKPCPVLAIPLGNDAEVDHEIPFAKIKGAWFKLHPSVKEVYENGAYALKDKTLEASWKAFHLENAVLRYVSKKGNRIAHLV